VSLPTTLSARAERGASPTALPGLLAWACGLLPAVVAAQDADDRRDRVTLKSGKEIHGRVWERYTPDELVLLQGGRRVRIPRDTIRDIHTVNDDLREFFAHRSEIGDQPKRAGFLVEWAASRKLAGMAEAQALAVVLRDPDHAGARAFLGHRARGKEWSWPLGDRWLTREQFAEHHGKWGTALTLRGEHFEVKTDAGLERGLAALFDLERFYLFFVDTFGAALPASEALEPIRVQVWGSMFKFPAISARKLPYFDLRSDAAATFYRPDAKRPEQLFAVATQALIYRCLVGGQASQSRSHLCAWVEIGLGQWAESAFGGKPGWAEPRKKVVLDTLVASAVLRLQPELKRVTHLEYELFHELSPRASLRWDASSALVHYLMAGEPDPKVRQRFMRYLELAFRKGLGDSSTAFDKTMELKVEELEKTFYRWLKVKG
jgi:hypothetical protein